MTKRSSPSRLGVAIANPDNIWLGYDPDKAGRALENLAGAWSSLDTTALARDIRRRRKEGSRG